MTTLTEGIHTGEFLRSQADGTRSIDQVTVTVAGGAGHVSGTVLGKITASGKYLAYLDSASDGSQTAAAILLSDLKGVANGDVKAVIVNADAEVEAALLTGLDANARADLLALGIKCR